MKSLKISLIATLIGTAIGTAAWIFGLGNTMWPAHPQMACFLLTLASAIATQIAWPWLFE